MLNQREIAEAVAATRDRDGMALVALCRLVLIAAQFVDQALTVTGLAEAERRRRRR